MNFSNPEPTQYSLTLIEIDEKDGVWSDRAKTMIDSLNSCEFLPFTVYGTNSDAVGFITTDFKNNLSQEDFTSLINMLTSILERKSLIYENNEYIFNKNKIQLLLVKPKEAN